MYPPGGHKKMGQQPGQGGVASPSVQESFLPDSPSPRSERPGRPFFGSGVYYPQQSYDVRVYRSWFAMSICNLPSFKRTLVVARG
jgi:hypothetical protein